MDSKDSLIACSGSTIQNFSTVRKQRPPPQRKQRPPKRIGQKRIGQKLAGSCKNCKLHFCRAFFKKLPCERDFKISTTKSLNSLFFNSLFFNSLFLISYFYLSKFWNFHSHLNQTRCDSELDQKALINDLWWIFYEISIKFRDENFELRIWLRRRCQLHIFYCNFFYCNCNFLSFKTKFLDYVKLKTFL